MLHDNRDERDVVAPGANGQIETAERFVVALVWSGITTRLHYLSRAILGGLKS
jgi:hypothetical protein